MPSIEWTERAMTDDEREVVESWDVDESLLPRLMHTGYPIAFTVGALSAALKNFHLYSNVFFGVAAVIGAIFSWRSVSALVALRRSRDIDTREDDWIDATLSAGRVRTARFRSARALEIVPRKNADEYHADLLDLGEGRLFVLSDGDCNVIIGEGPDRWPCTEFELIETPDGKRAIEVLCHGEAIADTRQVAADAFSSGFLRRYDSDHEVIPEDFDDFVKANRGACKSCDYSLRGIDFDQPCPKCGTVSKWEPAS